MDIVVTHGFFLDFNFYVKNKRLIRAIKEGYFPDYVYFVRQWIKIS